MAATRTQIRKAMQARRRRRHAGFTLMEILIVIVILMALGGLVAINLIDVKEEAEVDVMKLQLKNLQDALEDFRFRMGRYPTEEEGLSVLWSKEGLEDEEDEKNWRQFLKKPMREDRWGNPWNYRAESEYDLDYDLWSNGPDGEEDTEDDITSWSEFMDEEGEMFDDMPDLGPDMGDGG